MPVTLNQFFAHANDIGANENPLFARNEQIQDNSAFPRLRFNARAEENRATVNEFLNAILQDPQYAQYIGVAQSIFDVRLECAAPLTSKDILWAKELMDTSMHLAQNNEVCQQLAGPKAALPEYFGTSLAQFCTLQGRVLQSTQDPEISGLLRDFITAEILPQHVKKMCIDRGMPNEAPHMADLLQKTGVMERALDKLVVNNNLKNMEFSTIMQFVTDQSALSMDVLLALRASDMPDVLQGTYKKEGILANIVKSDDCVNLLDTLTEAVKLNNVPINKIGMFYQAIIEEHWSVDSPAAQADALRSFLLNTEGAGRMQSLLQQQGLPENLAAPLGRHPAVMAGARTLLHDAVPPPAAPTREQAQQALQLAGEDFLVRKGSEIYEFVVMAADPPVQLAHNPLSAESLPLYINALLEGQNLLQPLFDDSITLDAAFMTRVVDYKDALNSCSFGAQKALGADESTALHANVLRLLLAVNGQVPSQDLLKNVLNKFGPLASEFGNIGELVGPNKLDFANIVPLMQACRGGTFVLETIAKELIVQLPPNTLERMGIAGKTPQERMFNYIQDNFQKETPFEEVSVRFRAFANSLGTVMPPMDPAVQARLEAREFSAAEAALRAARRDTKNTVLAEFFPSGSESNLEENPLMFYDVFDEAAQNADLAGLDPEKIDASNMYPKAQHACSVWMQDHAGPVTAADLRPLIMASIAEDLQVMKNTLDAVDAMNEQVPQGGIDTLRAFSPAEKAIIKDVVMATGLQDINVIAEIATLAKDTISEMVSEMQPHNTDANVCRMLEAILAATQSINRYIAAHQGVDGSGALDAMIRMLIPLGGAEESKLRALFNDLSGPLGQSIAGGIMYAVNMMHEGGNPEVLISAIKTMVGLREHLGASLGIKVAKETFFFSNAAAHISQVSSHTMSFVNRYAEQSFSPLARTLADIRPSLNQQDWNTLAGIGQRMINAGQGTYGIENLLKGNAPALLAASHANGGKELSPSQIWQAITSKKAPLFLKEENFAVRLHTHLKSIYQSALIQAYPDMDSSEVGELSERGITWSMGVSFLKLLELIKPDSSLDLGDMKRDMKMSSLTGYDQTTAYGLVIDFRRGDPNTVIQLRGLEGQDLFHTHPFYIPDEQNVPGHPHFNEIIGAVQGMCASEAQKACVLQTFSQASLMMPGDCSMLFPGFRMNNEIGGFSKIATLQADGSVAVDISSSVGQPLKFHVQFVIQINGDHECTAFSMERR